MDVLAKSCELISCANEIKKILQDIDYCMAVAFLWLLNFVNSVHICMLQQSYSSSTAILLESLVSWNICGWKILGRYLQLDFMSELPPSLPFFLFLWFRI